MSCKHPSWTSHLACSQMGRGRHILLEYNLKRKVFSEYREVRWTSQILCFILFFPYRLDFSSLLLWYLQHVSIYKESKVWGNREYGYTCNQFVPFYSLHSEWKQELKDGSSSGQTTRSFPLSEPYRSPSWTGSICKWIFHLRATCKVSLAKTLILSSKYCNLEEKYREDHSDVQRQTAAYWVDMQNWRVIRELGWASEVPALFGYYCSCLWHFLWQLNSHQLLSYSGPHLAFPTSTSLSWKLLLSFLRFSESLVFCI